jgi:hypothetical protein
VGFEIATYVRHHFLSPDYSPTREIDQRRPLWRLDDPQHTRIPGSSCS